ncbi:SEC-C domain-containing protein [Metabacillus sp. RGM 3146]|uniref:SEC-C domain-containing protein n=1 Tax=Metabacillus sp. RGM 3146 TaxID=3401092 RepID=UPI003B9C8061
MAIDRNAPCPCGSGKKYKKCCMLKENVVQMSGAKVERFMQRKQTLVMKIGDFLGNHISFSESQKLQAEFKERSGNVIPDSSKVGLIDFWIQFFYKFENGLRGIEWFYQENADRLKGEEKEMAKSWTALKPQLIQAVDVSTEFITFENIFTKDTYKVQNSEKHEFAPWYGTFALLEAFEGSYYFNGMWTFQDPRGIQAADEKTNELAEKQNLPLEEVLFDYYPEIFAAMLGKEERNLDDKKQVTHYHQEYLAANAQALLPFFSGQEAFNIDKWNDQEKRITWVGNWMQYGDSEIKVTGTAFVGEVFGTISILDGLLTFISSDKEKADEFKKLADGLKELLFFKKEFEESITLPAHIEVKSQIAYVDEGVPMYFASFAQNAVSEELDKLLPVFSNRTIRELVEAGEKEKAENWMRQREYNMYQIMETQFSNREVTADFNSARRELGLPLSPFVTGGAERYSILRKADHPNSSIVANEDIPLYEAIGFTPNNVRNFYAEDLKDFFWEKTEGKSDNTIRKYRNNLFDLREILESKNLENWNDCDSRFWKQLFKKDLFDLYHTTSKTQLKEFESTMKALAKWLDKKHGTKLAEIVVQLVIIAR